MEGKFIDLFDLVQISVGEYGKIKTVDLKPNGDDIPVTNDNRFVKNKSLFILHFFFRSEFVSLYLEYILNSAVVDRCAVFQAPVQRSNALN